MWTRRSRIDGSGILSRPRQTPEHILASELIAVRCGTSLSDVGSCRIGPGASGSGNRMGWPANLLIKQCVRSLGRTVNSLLGKGRRGSPALSIASLVLIAALWPLWSQRAETQPVGVKEPELKAVFLFNFAQFVEWPVGAFADARSAIVIGILGDDPFGRVLDDVVRGEVVGGRALVVERFGRVEDIRACHILFVGQFDAEHAHIFATSKGDPSSQWRDRGFAARGAIDSSGSNHIDCGSTVKPPGRRT